MPLNLAIVEDHPIFAEALTHIIRNALPGVQISQLSSFRDAKQLFATNANFDLILLDLWLPDVQGFEALIYLRSQLKKVPIVIVSAFSDLAIIERSKICGASGFIPKCSKREKIIRALSDVLDGRMSFPSLKNGSEIDMLTVRLKSLTPQQFRVLEMLCCGKQNKQIAYELAINETTVKAHVSEVLRKLSVASRTQAVLEVSKLDFRAVLALYNEDATSS